MNSYTQRIAELTALNPYIMESNQKQVKPITELELQSIEREIGHSFPADYREFLSEYGGVRLGANQCYRAALYHLGDPHFGRASISDFYDALGALEEWRELPQRIPPDLLPMGEDGNVRLFLAIEGEYCGSVYQWYPSYFPENLYYYPELELVTRSFDNFVQSLKPLEEGYYNKPSHYEQEKHEIGQILENLSQMNPVAGNQYSEIMASLQARYVYATLGEEAKSLTEADLQHIEQEIGHPLPADYREFLRSFGGYSFIPSLSEDGVYRMSVAYPYIYPPAPYKQIGTGHYEGMVFFHGHMGHDYHDLLGHYLRTKDYLPPDMLPIADAGELCVKLAGDNAGAVFKVDSNVTAYSLCPSYGGSGLPLKEESQTIVASSFDEFLHSLRRGIKGTIIGL